MYLYLSASTNPYFNIATEEYFFKHFDNDFFSLYINEPSLIVGKHQNCMAEINVNYVMDNNIKVVRRLSGGGTVFHDHGNLNYSFIRKGKEGHLVDFKKYTQPVIDLLQSLNVDARLRGKSDLVIGDKKFSGNAEHLVRDKILHHGTILFNSKLDALDESIKADWDKFKDKAVRSNRSQVTNILPHLEQPLTMEAFKQKVVEFIQQNNNDVEAYQLTPNDRNAINELMEKKYSTWDWNFGYSPLYEFKQDKKLDNGKLNVWLKVKKGIILDATVCHQNGQNNNCQLGEWFIHQPHDYFRLKNLIETQLMPKLDITPKELLSALF